MVYYAMPLIMKSENGASSQQQQLCLNSNQMVVSDNYNGQLPAPQQPQLINLSNGDVSISSPSQQNYTYQLLTTNDQQQSQLQQPQQPAKATTTSSRTPKTTKSFKCDQCNMTFTTKSAHTSHIKSHAKQQAASSQIQTAGSSVSPNQQMQSSDPYQCDVCKKTFAVPARLVSPEEISSVNLVSSPHLTHRELPQHCERARPR
jgi:hypothetical protein